MTISARQLAELFGSPAPTEEQVAVIQAPLAPCVVIAGAGSGKTETMAARVVWLIANRMVAPDQVLGLTFTRKAAAELAGRVRHRLAQWRVIVERTARDDTGYLAALLAGEPTVLTYSAYAGRLVGEHALRLGQEPSPRLLSQAVRWQLADSVVRRYGGELPVDIGALASVTQYVLGLADHLADHLVTPDHVVEFASTVLADWDGLPWGSARSATPRATAGYVKTQRDRLALVPLVRAFERAKRELGGVDYGDQMALAAALAELPDVAGAERSRYAAVLLDEYQDTGHAQVTLLSGLFGRGHPVTAVGDPHQSIYGWRGAAAGNMGRFASTFPHADGSPAIEFPLATSWRNDERILAAANVIARGVTATQRAGVRLRARSDAHPGRILATVTPTVEDEAVWLARRLAHEWQARPAGGRTAAVLVRRRAQIPLIREALLDAGLPVEVVGLGGLLMTPEVADVVATLRVLADHRSGPALARLLTGARWRIGASDLAALSRRARRLVRGRMVAEAAPAKTATAGESSSAIAVEDFSASDTVDQASLVEALDDLGLATGYSLDGYRRLAALSAELRRLRQRLGGPLPELVAEVEHVTGVGVEVAARADRARVGRAHLDRFLDEAGRFAADADEASLGAFLAFVDAAEIEENGLEAGEAVVAPERIQVLTVHGAKGLEWDLVAVPGLVEKVFPAEPKAVDWTRTRQLLPAPLRGDRADLPHLEVTAADRVELADHLDQHATLVRERHRIEERRLAYVAVTRARSMLLASGYAWDNAKEPRQPSAFLVEIRDLAEVDEWFVSPDGAVNPRLSAAREAIWPVDPLGDRRPDVEAGAELVRAALRKGPDTVIAGARRSDVLPGLVADRHDRAAGWRRDVDLLLAEYAAMSATATIDVALPAQLSVSQLVALRRDPDELARRLRRPLPARPAPLARRGTAFHTWLERRWSAQTLLDVDELPGAADESADDADFAELRRAFEASPWAERTPYEVEVPFDMTIGPVLVRGRMDAVFGDADGGWTVVDWKTGTRPGGADADAAAVQLAAYRLAWARLQGIGDARVGEVRAAFHYVRSGETIAPADLLDAAGMRELISGEAAGASARRQPARPASQPVAP
jgi:DNA helicase II / ATP-dependent DNA helicase PcrA